MTRNRRMAGGWVDQARRTRSINGRPFCRWCKGEIPQGSRRRTFCSQACVDEHRIRTDPQFARWKVFHRDRGVCTRCGLDTEYLRRTVSWLQGLAFRQWRYSARDATGAFQSYRDSEWRDEHALAALEQLERQYFGRSCVKWTGSWGPVDHLWEADHIVPVIEGGGECGLDGYRTLCIPCHKAVTAELRRRLAGRAPQPQIEGMFGPHSYQAEAEEA